MAYSLPIKANLPTSFKHEFVHLKPEEVILRANVQTETDIQQWISEFGRNSRTQWNLRTSKPTDWNLRNLYVRIFPL